MRSNCQTEHIALSTQKATKRVATEWMSDHLHRPTVNKKQITDRYIHPKIRPRHQVAQSQSLTGLLGAMSDPRNKCTVIYPRIWSVHQAAPLQSQTVLPGAVSGTKERMYQINQNSNDINPRIRSVHLEALLQSLRVLPGAVNKTKKRMVQSCKQNNKHINPRT